MEKLNLRSMLEKEQLFRLLRREFSSLDNQLSDLSDADIFRYAIQSIIRNKNLSLIGKFDLMTAALPDEEELLLIIDEEFINDQISRDEYEQMIGLFNIGEFSHYLDELV